MLAEYGPEAMVKDRIVAKLKEGQDTDVNKHNIKIRSFSGTEDNMMYMHLTNFFLINILVKVLTCQESVSGIS